MAREYTIWSMSLMATFCFIWGIYMKEKNITNRLDSLLKSYLNNDAATFKDLVFYNANSQDPKDRITIGSNSHAIKRTSLIYNFFDR